MKSYFFLFHNGDFNEICLQTSLKPTVAIIGTSHLVHQVTHYPALSGCLLIK